MRLSRLFTPQPLVPGSELDLEPASCRRLGQVLRLRAGAALVLFNGDGRDYPGTLLESGKRGCRVSVDGAGDAEPLPPLDIGLAIGISRSERMDLALQKAVELGVTRLQPLLSDFCNQKQVGDWEEKRHRHWQQIVVSACEQSGRRRLPVLEPALGSHPWLQQVDPSSMGLLLDPEGDQALDQLTAPDPGQSLFLLVGPEGGLSPAEVKAATGAGFRSVRLGPRVLRTETAPLAAIAAIQALWGDFRG